MKNLIKIIAVVGLTSTIAGTAAFGQPLITVDELGKGTFNGTVLPSGPKADPFSGIVTLAYQLPFPGVPGDVQLFEPNTPLPTPLSDLIRFDGQGLIGSSHDSTPGTDLYPMPATTFTT